MLRSRFLVVLSVLGALLVTACGDEGPFSSDVPLQPPRASDLGDATIDPDAFQGFWVRTPLAPEEPTIDDTFNPSFRVFVEICLHSGDPHASEIAGYDACETPAVPLFGPDDIQVSVADEFYKVNYDTDRDGPDLLTQRYYRIFWLIDGAHVLGYRDIYVADPAPNTPPPTTVEAYGARKGEVVPMKVFIGTICDLPCGAGGFNTADGVELPFVDENGTVVGGLFIPPQDFSEPLTVFGQQVAGTDAEVCFGPDFDGILLQPCFDIDALQDPSQPIVGTTISLCIDEEAIETNFGLAHAAVDAIAMAVFQDDGEIWQLQQSQVDLFCEPQLGASSGPLTRLATGAIHLIFPFAYPPALHAIDLNDTFSTTQFPSSHYAFFIPGTGEAVQADLGIQPEGTVVTPVVQIVDAALDGMNGVTVHWSVAAGGGSVAHSETITQTLDGNPGQSSNPWTLGPPGAQELHATILGITEELLGHYEETLVEPLVIVFTAVSCEQGFGTPSLPLDGVIGTTEWECAESTTFTANVSGGSGVTATLLWMNDQENLYLAIKLPRDEADRVNSVRIDFDNTLDGTTADDDVIGYDAGDQTFYDHFLGDRCVNRSQSSCSEVDLQAGGTRDGSAAFANDGTHSVYELAHPLNSGDARDFALTRPGQVGQFITLQTGNGAQGNTQWPGFRSYFTFSIK